MGKIIMGIIPAEIIINLDKLLSTSEAKDTYANIASLSESGAPLILMIDLMREQSAADKIRSWGKIAKILSETYRVHHGDTSRNPLVKTLIQSLCKVADYCLADCKKIVEGEESSAESLSDTILLEVKSELQDIFQLVFVICEFYSVNTKNDKDKTEIYVWIKKAESFRNFANLSRTIIDAKFLEFEASELSRHVTQENPYGTQILLEQIVKIFEESLSILEENWVTLDGPDGLTMQHTMNGLSIAISKQMLAAIECVDVIDAKTMETCGKLNDRCLELLNEMESFLLKPGIDARGLRNSYKNLNVLTHVALPKQMGNLLATKGLIGLLNGEPIEQLESIFQASLRCMPEDNTPQYANLEIRYANCCVTYAAFAYIFAKDETKLESISDHQYVKVARKLAVLGGKPDCSLESVKELIARSEELMTHAVELYADAFTRTKAKDEGLSYGKHAVNFLKSISKHPACLNNRKAMEILNPGKPAQSSNATARNFRRLLPTFELSQSNRTALSFLVGLGAVAVGAYLTQGQDTANTNSNKLMM